VRGVAGDAPLDPDGSVLEDERPALLHVAADARLPVQLTLRSIGWLRPPCGS
jgi:hypothetical protein